MQTTGYIIDQRTNSKIKVLVRGGRKYDNTLYERLLKMRITGKDGNHFEDEENYLNQNYNIFDELLNGEIIGC